MLKIGVLASGALGLKAVQHLSQSNHDLVCVLTDKGSISIISFCETNDIPYFAGNPRQGKGYNFIRNFKIEVLASINYLFLIESDMIAYPSGIAFNLHGSLLPKYRGRTPHVWAIINGEKETGITAHLIETNCDTGDIIEQVSVKIDEEDTGADVLAKYMDLYIPLIDSVLFQYLNNTLKTSKQIEKDASFYGKRTPDSGHIDWTWKAERIRNWIRAQADPYPGAFGFIDGKKIIIDKIIHSTVELTKDTLSGELIYRDGKWLCAAADGFVELVSVRVGEYKLENNKIIE